MPHRRFDEMTMTTLSNEFEKFDTLTGREKEALLKRLNRLGFEEEFNRETTQKAISRHAEAAIDRLEIKAFIAETATRSAQEASRTTMKSWFSYLDIDPENRDETRNFRDDMRFIRGIRKNLGDAWSKAIGLILVAILLAGLYGAWTHVASGPPTSTHSSVK